MGKQLNSAGLHVEASEWLKEASKRFDEYYDLHQVTAIEILEELAISLINSNQERMAKDIVGKILRIDSNNQITTHIKQRRRRRSSRSAATASLSTTLVDLCRPIQLLSFLTSTCPI
jgi:hypothetical protein